MNWVQKWATYICDRMEVLKTRYVLLTGSDLGDKLKNLKDAMMLIESRIGEIEAVSDILESEPWGFESSTTFLNQALVVETELLPEQILEVIKEIENSLGRESRSTKEYVSRLIDIDILCGEGVIHRTEKLSVPHSLLHKRVFALKPLCQLVPEWQHPLLVLTYQTILDKLLAETPSQSPN